MFRFLAFLAFTTFSVNAFSAKMINPTERLSITSLPATQNDEQTSSLIDVRKNLSVSFTAAAIAFSPINNALAENIQPYSITENNIIAMSAQTSDIISVTETFRGSTSMMISAASTNQVSSAAIQIADIFFDGKVPTTESDEYVVIKNYGKGPADVSGYYIYVATTGTQGPTYYFPKGTILKPGQAVRIYTNEIHPETGGFSFDSKKAIWSNNGGLAVFKDNNGKKIMEFKYKKAA